MILQKSYNADLDYAFDWNDDDDPWLEEGEIITDFDITVPVGITLGSNSKSPAQSDGKVTIWLSGGVPGRNYRVSCKITTSQARVDERTIQINVRKR